MSEASRMPRCENPVGRDQVVDDHGGVGGCLRRGPLLARAVCVVTSPARADDHDAERDDPQFLCSVFLLDAAEGYHSR